MSDALLVFGSNLVLPRFRELHRAAAATGLTAIDVVLGARSTRPSDGGWRIQEPTIESNPLEAATRVAEQVRQLPVTVAGGVVLGEQSVIAGSAALEELGHPGPSLLAARRSRNKLLQRETSPAFSPCWTRLDPQDRAAGVRAYEGAFPAVLKPTTRHSSSGVRRVTDPQQALALAQETEYDGETLLLEQLVEGQEVSIESIVVAGRAVRCEITVKATTESGADTFVETSHTVGGAELNLPARRLLLRANERVIGDSGVHTAATHAEFRLSPDGVILMEIAVRPGGDAIGVLHHLSSGVPLERTLFAAAIGMPAPVVPSARRSLSQQYVLASSGSTVMIRWPNREDIETCDVSVAGNWPDLAPWPFSAPPGIRCILRHAQDGKAVREVRNSGDRLCSVILDAPDPASLSRLRQNGLEGLQVATARQSEEPAARGGAH